MLSVEIQGTNYRLKDNWSDISLSLFGELCALPMPKKLREKYRAMIEEKEPGEDSHRDIIKTYPSYYGKVIRLLSDIPQSVVDRVEWTVRTQLYNDYLLPFVVSTCSAFPQYSPVGATSFKLDGEEFFLPVSLKHGGKEVPMYKESIATFSESADIEVALHEWGEKGIEAMGQVCAVYLRKEGEQHSDELVLQRTEKFKELPMSVVWEVFFCIVILGWQYVEGIQTFSRRVLPILHEQAKKAELTPSG